MIQDIEPHCYSNAYEPAAPALNSSLLCYSGRKVLVKTDKNGEITFPGFGEIAPYIKGGKEECTYLFSIDGQRYYLGEGAETEKIQGYSLEDIEVFRTALPKYRAFAGITGYQLSRWYADHRFCGRCGSRMEQDREERMMKCPACANREYPKIMPAVIIGLTHGNRLLMSKYANRDFKKYALLAGFAEIGETIEDTVRREVMEEVGLKVKNITYYKSQPWSFSDTLLLGFYAELDGEAKITLDKKELAMAEWFEREDIPVKAADLSLTNEMIMRFKNNQM